LGVGSALTRKLRGDAGVGLQIPEGVGECRGTAGIRNAVLRPHVGLAASIGGGGAGAEIPRDQTWTW